MCQKFLRTTLSLFFLSLLFPLVSFSQQNIRVSGKIKDADNNPVAGASVSVKGTSNAGTIAGDDGSYTIEVLPNATLVFSSSGYDPREIAVNNKQQVDVVLNSRASELSDVVVIGYGSRQKKDITGAISTIKPKDIEKSTALSPELAMQGQMAGVDVTSAGGNPTARPTVRIRGTTSFNNADPLYVIDGVPFYEGGSGAVVDPTNDPTRRGPINIYTIVNPNDIESISVLKDASASAIYGVRAANGVILITTKQGKKGRVKVDFDAQMGTQKIPDTYDVLNTQQYVKFYTDLYNAYPDKTAGGVPVPIEQADFFGPLWDPSNPEYIGNRQTYNWQDAVINDNSKLQNFNVRASGASDNTSYNFAVGYANNDGPFAGYNAERYSIATNVTSRIGKYFEAGINLRGVQTRTKNPDATINLDVYRAAPWQAIYDPNGPLGYAPLWKLNEPITPDVFNTTTLPGEYPFISLSAGIPAGTKQKVHIVNFNDLVSVEYIMKKFPVACVLTEPVLQNIGVVLPEAGYLQGLYDLCEQYGALCIFDEVKTGFRSGPGGYQEICGVKPHLSVFGKAVANGYPLGVIGGKKKIMELFDSPDPEKRVLIAGTYNAHPVNAAAAIATLEMLKNPEVYKQIDDICNRLYTGLEKLFTEKGIPHVLVKNASAFCSYFMEKQPADLHDLLENQDFGFDLRYRKALIEKGIYHIPIACKQGSISYAHTNDDIDKTLEITREVLKSI